MLPIAQFVDPFGLPRSCQGYPVFIHQRSSSPHQWAVLPRFRRRGDIAWDIFDEGDTDDADNSSAKDLWIESESLRGQEGSLNERNKTEKENSKSEARRKRKCHTLEMLNKTNKFPKIISPLELFLSDFVSKTNCQQPAELYCGKAIEGDIWQQKVDCKGCNSRDIKVKINNHEICVKAFRTKDTGNAKEISSLRKHITLPQNIDTDKVTCKMSSDGQIVFEAPYLKNDNQSYQRALLTCGFPELKPFNTFCCVPQVTDKDKRCAMFKEVGHKWTQDIKSRNKTKNIDKGNDQEETTNEDSNFADTAKLDPGTPQPQVFLDFSSSEDNNEDDPSLPLTKVAKKDEGNKNSSCAHQPNKENSETNKDTNEAQIPNDIDCDCEKSSEKETQEVIKDGKECESSNSSNIDTTHILHQETVVKDDSSENRILFRLEMPSYDPESIKVNFNEDERRLTISARREVGLGQGENIETVNKMVVVPEEVDAVRLQCQYRDGCLSVIAPQKRCVTERSIPVKL